MTMTDAEKRIRSLQNADVLSRRDIDRRAIQRRLRAEIELLRAEQAERQATA